MVLVGRRTSLSTAIDGIGCPKGESNASTEPCAIPRIALWYFSSLEHHFLQSVNPATAMMIAARKPARMLSVKCGENAVQGAFVFRVFAQNIVPRIAINFQDGDVEKKKQK